MSLYGALVPGALALTCTAVLWRPAQNTYIQLTYEDLPFVPRSAELDSPAKGYPLERPGMRDMVRSGYYAMPPFNDGVPVVDYRWMRSAGLQPGRHASPSLAAQYALWGCYQPWLATGDDALLVEFLRQADWLVAVQDADGAFRSRFALPARSLSEGWVSAMHQGMAASVLVRAFLATQDAAYLDAANKAVVAMLKPVSSGGTACEDEFGMWLEEYPEEPPSHVFNGFVFALYGLWDVSIATESRELRTAFDDCCRTLSANLDRYDGPDGMRYELRRETAAASSGYLQLQIAQLRTLTALSGDSRFADRADHWAERLTPSRRRNAAERLTRAAFSGAAYRWQQVRSAVANPRDPLNGNS